MPPSRRDRSSRTGGDILTEQAVWDRYAPWFIAEETDVYPPDYRELEFYRRLRESHGGPCLEIGAGYGRLAGSLHGEGSLTAALEPSGAMLDGWTGDDILTASRVKGVGQALPFRSSCFGIAAFPYNGIHCVLDHRERLEVLREAHRVLLPGGLFVIEVCHSFTFRPEEEEMERYDRVLRDGKSLRLVETVRRDVGAGTITYDMRYSSSERGEERILLVLSLIDRDEMADALLGAGFAGLREYGDYDMSAFSGMQSPRLLFLAEKGRDR